MPKGFQKGHNHSPGRKTGSKNQKITPKRLHAMFSEEQKDEFWEAVRKYATGYSETDPKTKKTKKIPANPKFANILADRLQPKLSSEALDDFPEIEVPTKKLRVENILELLDNKTITTEEADRRLSIIERVAVINREYNLEEKIEAQEESE